MSKFGKHDLWTEGWMASWKTGHRIAGNPSLPDCKAALSAPPPWFGGSQTELEKYQTGKHLKYIGGQG